MQRDLLVVGGGGHAKVVIDIALRSPDWRIAGVLDDSPGPVGRTVLGQPVLGGTDRINDFSPEATWFVVAIGSNRDRERLQERGTASGLSAATLIHPAAIVADSATIGAGSVVMAGAIVNPDARVGKGVILNSRSLVEHDCVIGDYSHVAPGATLCGAVSVGARTLVGVGACVIPKIEIGDDCTVGAGAAVVDPVPSGTRVVGVPAKAAGIRTV